MQEYEIRLTNKAGATTLISTSRYFSDGAAIRAAQILCKSGDETEVWRGDVCITTSTPRARAPLVWPVTPGKQD